MNRLFRKYHRTLAFITFLPLLLTVASGMGYVILDDVLGIGSMGKVMMKIHTLDFFGSARLSQLYIVLNGLGLVGMLMTGLSMMGMFRERRALKEE